MAANSSRVSIRAVGQIDTASNTVIYSVYVASREETLGGLQLSASMPPNTRFLESVDTPLACRYDGVADNIITWTVPALERDTLLGPFTFRVRIDASKADQTPTSPPSWLFYQKPTPELLEDPGSSEPLLPLAESGSITVDAKGTLNPEKQNTVVNVGETGVRLYVPEGAVTRQRHLYVQADPDRREQATAGHRGWNMVVRAVSNFD